MVKRTLQQSIGQPGVFRQKRTVKIRARQISAQISVSFLRVVVSASCFRYNLAKCLGVGIKVRAPCVVFVSDDRLRNAGDSQRDVSHQAVVRISRTSRFKRTKSQARYGFSVEQPTAPQHLITATDGKTCTAGIYKRGKLVSVFPHVLRRNFFFAVGCAP